MSMGSGKSTGTPNPSTAFGNQPGATTFGSYPTQQQTNQFSQGITPASTAGGQPNTLAQFAPGAGASATDLTAQNFNQGGSLTSSSAVPNSVVVPQDSPFLQDPAYQNVLGQNGFQTADISQAKPLSTGQSALQTGINGLSQASQNYQNTAFGPPGVFDPASVQVSQPAFSVGADGNRYDMRGQLLPPAPTVGADGYRTSQPAPQQQQVADQNAFFNNTPPPPSLIHSMSPPQSTTMNTFKGLRNSDYYDASKGYGPEFGDWLANMPNSPYGLPRPSGGLITPDRAAKMEQAQQDYKNSMPEQFKEMYSRLPTNPGLLGNIGFQQPQPTPQPTQSPQLTPVTGFMPPPPAPLRPPQPTTPAPIAQPQPVIKPTYETLQRNLGLTRGGSTSYTAPKPTPPQIVNRNNNTIFGTNRPQQKPVAGPIAPPKQNFGRQTPTYRISAGKISK